MLENGLLFASTYHQDVNAARNQEWLQIGLISTGMAKAFQKDSYSSQLCA